MTCFSVLSHNTCERATSRKCFTAVRDALRTERFYYYKGFLWSQVFLTTSVSGFSYSEPFYTFLETVHYRNELLLVYFRLVVGL